MVAARRLRKSMLKEMPNINIETVNNIQNVRHKHINSMNEDIYIKDNLGVFEDDKYYTKSFKLKYIIKMFVSILIIFSCLCTKLFFKEQALSNKYISVLINEYKKDYTKEGCIEKYEEIINSVYEKTKYIIPEYLAINIKEKYISSIKPHLINFKVKEVFNMIFTTSQEINNTHNNDTVENTGMGGGNPTESLAQTMEIPSQEAIAMKDKVEIILSKNIDIKQPVQGTITSKYGNREKIFDELSTYHTGIDIANNMGTKIYSATNGVVKKVEENNKYYGNNIEIETDGVIFKYAHLKSFNVKVGDTVNHESIIGYMGSTGMSTGPHLHFEIKIDGETIDPNQIFKFY